jgi:F-type H+-transporting ATPase subunit b
MRFTLQVAARCAAVVVALVVTTYVATCCCAQEHQEAEGVRADAEAAAEHAAEEEAHGEGPNPLAVDPDLAVWTGVVFLLLFIILSWFAWPQIAAAVDERERRIVDTIRAAEQKHEDAKRLLAEHEAKLAAAAGEVRALLDEARRDAEHTKSSIVADARKAAEDEKVRALRDIERAKNGAIHELAIASANVAVDLAGKVIRDKLTPEQNNQLVRDALAKLGSAPSNN